MIREAGSYPIFELTVIGRAIVRGFETRIFNSFESIYNPSDPLFDNYTTISLSNVIYISFVSIISIYASVLDPLRISDFLSIVLLFTASYALSASAILATY